MNECIIVIQKTVRGFLIRKKLRVRFPGYYGQCWELGRGLGMLCEFNLIVDNYFDEQAPSPFMSCASNFVKEVSNQESLGSRGSNSFEIIEGLVALGLVKPVLEPVNLFMFRQREKVVGYPEELKKEEVKRRYVIQVEKEPDVREIRVRGKVVVGCLSLGFVSRSEFRVVLGKPLCEFYFEESREEMGGFRRGDGVRKESFGGEVGVDEGVVSGGVEGVQGGNGERAGGDFGKIEEKQIEVLEGVQEIPVKRHSFVKKKSEEIRYKHQVILIDHEKTLDKHENSLSEYGKTPDKHTSSLSEHVKTPDKHTKNLSKHAKIPEKHQKTPEKYKKTESHAEIPKITPATKTQKNKTPQSPNSSIESASDLIERLTKDYQINLDSLSSSRVSSQDKPEKLDFKIRVPEKPVHPINPTQTQNIPTEPPQKYLRNPPKPQSQPKPASSHQEKKSKFFPYEKNFHILPLLYSQNFGFSNYKDYGFISDLNPHRPGLKIQKKIKKENQISRVRLGSCKSEQKFVGTGKKLPKFSPYDSKMIEKQYIEHFCLGKDVQTLNRNSGGYVVNEKIRQLYMK